MNPFDYVRARSIDDAVQAVAAGNGSVRFLGGGTTLFDLMKLGVERPGTLVDITQLPDLDDIVLAGGELRLGALVRMSDAADNEHIKRDYPMLSESLWRAASQQLRNMATLGGNLLQRTRCAYFRGGDPFPCNKRRPGSGCAAIGGVDRGLAVLGVSDACIANYPGDFAVALVALDAKLDVLGPSGPRTLPVEELHRDPGDTPHIETTLGPGEFIAGIRVPQTRAARASTYLKIRDRESYAFALASAAVALDFEGERIREARIAIGGVATRPWRARAAERLLSGRRLTRELADEAGAAALEGARPGRLNGFRITLAARTVADALLIAKERA